MHAETSAGTAVNRDDQGNWSAILLRSGLNLARRTFKGWGFRRFQWVNSIVEGTQRRLRQQTNVVIKGHRIFVDPQDSLELTTAGAYEPAETRFYERTCQPGDTVLDIGANIGYFTLLFARQVGPRGQVYSFEPEPTNFELLSKNVGVNGYQNVHLINRAVAQEDRSARLFKSEVNLGDHRIYDSGETRDSVGIEMVSLDSFFANQLPKVDLIKMDIQGAEYHAVLGMQELLRQNPDVTILTEFWPFGLTNMGVQPRAYLELLQNLGFQLFSLEPEGEPGPMPDLDVLLEELTPENRKFTNLICRRTLVATE